MNFPAGAPKISVVIPAYNAAWCIAATIESVLRQSFSDFELIVINDGSTDDTVQAIIAASGGDERVRIIHQENRGLAGARNRGWQEARGEFVACIDADDLWRPTYLAQTSAALEADEAAPFAFAYSVRIDADGNELPLSPWRWSPRHDFRGLFTVNSVGNGSASLFRKGALRTIGGFDETYNKSGLPGAEDWKASLLLARLGKPVLVGQYLVGYRILAKSMSRADPRRQLRAIEAVMADIKASFPEEVRRLDLRNAKTSMIGWTIPAFFAKKDFLSLVGLVARSYLMNPLFFLNRDLFQLHAKKIHELIIGFGFEMKPFIQDRLSFDLRVHPQVAVGDGKAVPSRP